MRKREILGELDLTPGQLRLIGFHSFVNLINVLVLELEALERDLEKPDLFLAAREQFVQVLHAFRDQTGELPLMQQLNEMRLILQTDLEKHAPQATHIMRILEVAHMRVEEMAARHGGDNRWVRMSFIRLRHSFELVFTVMSERRSGRGGKSDDYTGFFGEPIAYGENDRYILWLQLRKGGIKND